MIQEDLPFDTIIRVDRASLLNIPVEYQSTYKSLDIKSDIVASSDGTVVSLLPSLQNAIDATINNDTLTILTSKKQVKDVFNNEFTSIDDTKPLLLNTALKVYRFNPEVTSDTYINV